MYRRTRFVYGGGGRGAFPIIAEALPTEQIACCFSMIEWL